MLSRRHFAPRDQADDLLGAGFDGFVGGVDNVETLGIKIVIGGAHLVDDGLAVDIASVSYTHLRAHETVLDLVCRLLL